MNRRGPDDSSEYPLLMTAVCVVCVLGFVSSVVPLVEHIVGGALIVGAALWGAVIVLRRELRIRRRLADLGAPPAPGPVTPVHPFRAGAGRPPRLTGEAR